MKKERKKCPKNTEFLNESRAISHYWHAPSHFENPAEKRILFMSRLEKKTHMIEKDGNKSAGSKRGGRTESGFDHDQKLVCNQSSNQGPPLCIEKWSIRDVSKRNLANPNNPGPNHRGSNMKTGLKSGWFRFISKRSLDLQNVKESIDFFIMVSNGNFHSPSSVYFSKFSLPISRAAIFLSYFILHRKSPCHLHLLQNWS